MIECGEPTAMPVVPLHGSLANSAAWMGDVTLWAKRFRIFAVDVIGEPGLSAPSRPPLNSDAYAQWLNDVMNALRVNCASFIGVSLGGWLALDYAIRQPRRIDRMVLVCPGGVGRQKIGILFKVAFFNRFGAWGRRKLRNAIFGQTPVGEVSPALRKFGEFFALLHKSTGPRTEKLLVFSDATLKKLTMPILAIVGGNDALLDSAETRRRIEGLVDNGEVRYIEEAGHLIMGLDEAISEFLNGSST